MTKPGPKPKPHLQAVKEGNPGHKKLEAGVVLPPSDLIEPDWLVRLPGRSRDAAAVRARCAELWGQLAPVLTRSIGLVQAQQKTLEEYVLVVARIEQGERHLSTMGPVVKGERGYMRNPWLTLCNQYRQNYKVLCGELGLSPASATRLRAPVAENEGDPFD